MPPLFDDGYVATLAETPDAGVVKKSIQDLLPVTKSFRIIHQKFLYDVLWRGFRLFITFGKELEQKPVLVRE